MPTLSRRRAGNRFMINRIAEYLPAERTPRPAGTGTSLSGQTVRQWIEPIEELIVKYPAASLASAFVVGVAVAWWIKRR